MCRNTYRRPWRLPPRTLTSTRLAVFLSIVAALMLVVPITLASPPDPLWIAGIYDGADGDDLVTLLYETAAVEAVPLRPASPLTGSSSVSLSLEPEAFQGFPPCQFTRGPPSVLAPSVYDRHSRLQEGQN